MMLQSLVPLETYPGSKIVHLILQGLDIGEQNAWKRRTVSPFPQSVANSSAFSTVFLDPSPVAIVLLHVPKNLEWPG